MKAKNLATLVSLAVASLAAQAQSTPQYTLTDLGAIGTNSSSGFGISSSGNYVYGREVGSGGYAGFTWSAATGRVDWTMPTGHPYASPVGGAVNNAGVAVGTDATTTFGSGALPEMWSNGTTTALNMPSGDTTGGAFGINNNGIAVGQAGVGAVQTAMMFNTATNTPTAITATVAADGAYMTKASAINDAGLVVGTGINAADSAQVGLVYNSVTGSMMEIASSSAVTVTGVSQNGWVSYTSANLSYLWSAATGSVAVAMPTGYTTSTLTGVNSSGWSVGKASNQTFLTTSTGSYTLDSIVTGDAGWSFDSSSATVLGIADNGDLVVTGVIGGAAHAALLTLTPVPEPTTWTLMLAGVAAIGSVVRRRARKA